MEKIIFENRLLGQQGDYMQEISSGRSRNSRWGECEICIDALLLAVKTCFSEINFPGVQFFEHSYFLRQIQTTKFTKLKLAGRMNASLQYPWIRH